MGSYIDTASCYTGSWPDFPSLHTNTLEFSPHQTFVFYFASRRQRCMLLLVEKHSLLLDPELYSCPNITLSQLLSWLQRRPSKLDSAPCPAFPPLEMMSIQEWRHRKKSSFFPDHQTQSTSVLRITPILNERVILLPIAFHLQRLSGGTKVALPLGIE